MDAARHTGVITLFQQHFVKTGLVPAETGKVLSRAFEKRQNSDYGDLAIIDPADAQELSRAVRTFVRECGELLQRLVAEA